MKNLRSLLTVAAVLFASATASAGDAAPGIAPSQINAIYPDVEKLYIDLHRNPELAFHEKRTAATLVSRLKALGYQVTSGVGGTGIVAILKNGPGPVVMLRTELDALPIEEKTGLSFASNAKTKTDAGDTVPLELRNDIGEQTALNQPARTRRMSRAGQLLLRAPHMQRVHPEQRPARFAAVKSSRNWTGSLSVVRRAAIERLMSPPSAAHGAAIGSRTRPPTTPRCPSPSRRSRSCRREPRSKRGS